MSDLTLAAALSVTVITAVPPECAKQHQASGSPGKAGRRS
jgi:hypothetical protein